jgi:hypothetical protein
MKTQKGGGAMKRGRQGFAVERKSQLPQNAKEMKLILHITRKESWDIWNELRLYDYGSAEEAFAVVDWNYLRVPDPDERYYFYFYTEHENNEIQWHYVKIEKGATSSKGYLNWDEAKEYVKNWIEGEIYKIVTITEEGKQILGIPEFKMDKVTFLYEPQVMERRRIFENEDVSVYIFENALIDEIDEKMYHLRPCKSLNTIIIKSKKPLFIYPIDKETGYYKAEKSYTNRDVSIYEVMQRDSDNIVLKAYVDGEYKLIPI